MARPTPLSGFPEFTPAERIVEQHVLDTLRSTFESWGFASIETRAAEPTADLLRKGEIDKEVYLLRRLHADPDEEGGREEGGRELGLHFDLTVPFARYVLERSAALAFPFRRYQIQKVWRGERPQEGRYREFCQADIDVVGEGELAFHHDVEVAQVMVEALSRLPLPPLTLQLNNRRLIEGYYRGVGAEDVPAVMRAIDKIDKLPRAAVADLLNSTAGLSPAQAQACLRLTDISGTDAGFADEVVALGVSNPLLDQGLAELVAVVEGTAALAGPRVAVRADLRIARGLDYYTGTVYETRMAGLESLGSVCSGGRYESLASDGKVTYPGVGISFGVTRTLAPLLSRGLLTASRSVPSCVLVAVADESRRGESNAVAAVLRGRGIPVEVAPSADRFGKQIRHADRRGIPFVWFVQDGTDSTNGTDGADGVRHEVKDIRSGEQVSADPDRWQPPAGDLRPQVTGTA
jgi:histidyl-tRNA synthetase